MASKPSRMVELTSIISANTAKIDNYLSKNEFPHPSFDIEGPTSLNLPLELRDIREEIWDATLELQELLLGPKEVIADCQYNYFIAVQGVCKYDMASTFPLDGETTFGDMAKVCGLEVRKHAIVHTAFSKLPATDQRFKDYYQIGGEDMWPAASQTIPAMLKWPGSEESNQTLAQGFALAHDADDSVYTYLGKHPAKAMRFGSAMSVHLSGEGFASKHVLQSGPWASIKDTGTVVDIGGSNGDIAVAIAKAFPSLHLLVGRITMQAYDFFTPQPVRGADVYFFRWIFHNWADKYCLRILENRISALEPGSRIVLNEWCLPEPNTSSIRWERLLREMDLAMKTLQNSRERDKDDWKDIFCQASERFHFAGIQCPIGSQMSIIEFQ